MTMMPLATIRKILLFALSCLVLSSASAQLPLLPSEYADHPLLSRFQYSEIIEAEFSEGVNHLLVLGSLQRVREEVVPEKAERIRGNVTRILYEIPQGYSGEDVYRFFLEQMRQKSYVQLFSCEGRACGSSNYWANNIFMNRILYGPERGQYYAALRTNFGIENEPRISLYVITRGSRRIYAYVEIIETGGALPPINVIEPEAVLELLRDEGSVILPAISFSANDEINVESNLEYLAQLLQSDPSLRVYLVAHLSGAGTLAQLLQRSTARANRLKQELVSLGVAADRIEAQGVGPLAPACSGSECQERIELVLQ